MLKPPDWFAKTMKAASRTSLIKKVDRLFSRYVRQKHANEGGWVECCTCKKAMPWEDSQCGHWIKRGHHATRWDFRNVAPQCPGCNMYLSGAMDEFAAYICRTHGEDVMHELIRLKHTAKRWTIAELRELVEEYS
jgi:hypothetical protein